MEARNDDVLRKIALKRYLYTQKERFKISGTHNKEADTRKLEHGP